MSGKGLLVVFSTFVESTSLIVASDAFAIHFRIELHCICWDHASFTLLRFKVEFRALFLVCRTLADAFYHVEVVGFIA